MSCKPSATWVQPWRLLARGSLDPRIPNSDSGVGIWKANLIFPTLMLSISIKLTPARKSTIFISSSYNMPWCMHTYFFEQTTRRQRPISKSKSGVVSCAGLRLYVHKSQFNSHFIDISTKFLLADIVVLTGDLDFLNVSLLSTEPLMRLHLFNFLLCVSGLFGSMIQPPWNALISSSNSSCNPSLFGVCNDPRRHPSLHCMHASFDLVRLLRLFQAGKWAVGKISIFWPLAGPKACRNSDDSSSSQTR